MRHRTRYLILVVGFLVFVILAPLIILYISGLRYSFDQGGYVQTGVLSVKTDPKKTSVYLNDKFIDYTPLNARFLTPGEYEVKVRADGYWDWSKRLEVKSGKVTWAGEVLHKLYLFFQKPTSYTYSNNVLDFAIQNNIVTYITPKYLVITQTAASQEAENIPLPKPVEHLILAPNTEHILMRSEKVIFIYDTSTHTLADISNLVSSSAQLTWSNDGQLYALDNNVLYNIRWTIKQKTALISGIKTFTLLGDDIYYLKQLKQSLELVVSKTQAVATDPNPTPLQTIPFFKNTQLVISEQKEIFVVADNALYRINNKLEQLSEHITGWSFDKAYQGLIYTTDSAVYYYDLITGRTTLITRSSASAMNAMIRPELGYVFFLQNNQLVALELDTLDHQNQYILHLGQNLKKFVIDSAGKTVYLTDGGSLQQLTIR